MSTSAIAAVLKTLPDLTPNGLGLYEEFTTYVPPEERAVRIHAEQERLLADVAGFEAACSWLKSRAKIKSINRKHCSYGLKHYMERDKFGYVSQGTFIAAAVHMGFNYACDKKHHSIYINISEKALTPLSQVTY